MHPWANHVGFCLAYMGFTWHNNPIILQGLSPSTPTLMELHDFYSHSGPHTIGLLVHLLQVDSATSTPEVPLALKPLLSTYADVFREPTGLPPHRSQDHKIQLFDGAGPISSRPYQYPYYQKGEIEKLISEMLSSSIIRPSQSPLFFSNPTCMQGRWELAYVCRLSRSQQSDNQR